MYQTLILSGGGINGFEILGALHYLHNKKVLESIHTYSGCSIGSIICYLLVIGYTPYEMLSYLLTRNMLEELSKFDMSKLIHNKGLTSYEPIYNLLHDLTIQKLETIPTMKELYEKTKKELFMSSFNLTQYRQEYIHHSTHPNMSVLDACRASSSLPFIFDEFEYENNLYIDGGILNNFPEKIPNHSFQQVLAVNVSYSKKHIRKESELIEKIQGIFMASIRTNTAKRVRRALKRFTDVIDIQLSAKETFYNFGIGKTKCLDKFSVGYVFAKMYLS
jgi:predicted acylesterase/phospholipase RssA